MTGALLNGVGGATDFKVMPRKPCRAAAQAPKWRGLIATPDSRSEVMWRHKPGSLCQERDGRMTGGSWAAQPPRVAPKWRGLTPLTSAQRSYVAAQARKPCQESVTIEMTGAPLGK